MASPRSQPQQHGRSMSNTRFAGMIPPLMLVNPSDLQMNGVRVDGSLLSSKTFIDSMTASFSHNDTMSPGTPEFMDSPSSTVSADSFMPHTPPNMHHGRFMCPEPSCTYSIVGLNSAGELEQHVATGSHLNAGVEFELDLSGEDHASMSHHDNGMLPSPMYPQSHDYFALPTQPKGKSWMQGSCSCRYCNPHQATSDAEVSRALELAPAVGGNGFDHRTWQQNMKLEKAMQAVLSQHQRMRENEAMQQSFAFTNNSPVYGNFYASTPVNGFSYNNAFAY